MAHPVSERDVPSPVAHAGAGVKTLKRVLDVAYRSAYRTQCEQPKSLLLPLLRNKCSIALV
jgi:hypothetical protein